MKLNVFSVHVLVLQEFKVGKTAMQYIDSYHQLCHYQFNLFDKCKAKVSSFKYQVTT